MDYADKKRAAIARIKEKAPLCECGCGTSVTLCAQRYWNVWNRFVSGHNTRGKTKMPATCIVEGCERKPIAKNLCDAHYQRKRHGIGMAPPIHERGGTCMICSKPNYGLGACKKHYHRVRAWFAKAMLVKLLGGKCFRCKKKYPLAALDFHHRNPNKKKFMISGAVNNKSYKELEVEAKKCDLLCANCHRIHHLGEEKWQILTKQLERYWKTKEQ
jgi:hypothetical protein